MFYCYRCKRFKCFNITSNEERDIIFKSFYEIPSKNLQDSHLAGLISINNIKQRRSRKIIETCNSSDSDGEAMLPGNYHHIAAYQYKVRVMLHVDDNDYKEVSVCKKAFLSFHAITTARLRRIQSKLCSSATSPIDNRGKHGNIANKLPPAAENLILDHIKSFKPRQSHYSIRKNPSRYYLAETLTVRKMHKLFIEEYRIYVSYKVYWNIFKLKFNIKFGLPSTDTCNFCDTTAQKILSAENNEDKVRLGVEKKIHLSKAEAFHNLKRNARLKAKHGKAMVISFDYMQNLPLPHIRNNAVFFCRQLWYYVFGIHNMGDDSVSMYTYDETTAKKGANDVTSLLFHFFVNNDITSRDLILISDGCPGQNKNYVMVHFLYCMVHVLNMFDTIKYIFPVRGHSYLPNDQDFSLIGKLKNKVTVETHAEWDAIIESCRSSPTPFNVIKASQDMFFNMKAATESYFTKTPRPAVKLRGLRMYKINKSCEFLKVRESYSGPWLQCNIRSRRILPTELTLNKIYNESLPLNSAKIKNLIALSKVLTNPANCAFYESLQSKTNGEEEEDIDNEDNSSGCDE